jgi:hypothetical protein
MMQGNARWAKLANTLLSTLLASPEGQKYLLNEDPLVKEIVKGFAQLDPVRYLMQSQAFCQLTILSITLSHKRIPCSQRNVWRKHFLAVISSFWASLAKAKKALSG